MQLHSANDYVGTHQELQLMVTLSVRMKKKHVLCSFNLLDLLKMFLHLFMEWNNFAFTCK